MRVVRTNHSTLTIDNLVPCLSYWVVVTSLDCVNHVSSSPQLLGLVDLTLFKFSLSFGNSVSCQSWIVEDLGRKLTSVQNSISVALEGSSCGMPLPCVANSHFTCGNDPSLISYE